MSVKLHVFFLFVLSMLSLSNDKLLAQCPNNNILAGDLTPLTTGNTQTAPCAHAGEYFTVQVCSGTSYTFSTCGDNDFDTQLTLYNSTGGAALAFNDDGGCGVQSLITWTATYTGSVWILLDQYFCANVSGACMTLNVTQNTACTNFPPCNGLCSPGGTPPAEDNCVTALNLGSLPAPAPCVGTSGGLGAAVIFNLSNICASPANPYTYMSNCADGTNMAAPALDVWYQINITATQLVITLEAGMNVPVLGLWRDVGLGCGGLQPAGCTTGAAGYANEVFGPLFPGTYYLQISGGDLGDQCEFLLTLQNNNSCADCLVGQNLTATPPPVGGIYAPGTTVTFCYTLNDYNDAAAVNWIHGIVPIFGNGWNLATLTPQAPPAGCGTGAGVGTWAWYNNPITGQNGSSAQTTSVGPGFFHESNFGCPGACNPANPGDNWGDNLGIGGCSLVFCWQITSMPAGAACLDEASLNVVVETYADSETGSWTQAGCQNDPDLDFYATLNCCDVNATITNNGPLCIGGTLQLNVSNVTPGVTTTYQWSGPDGYTSTLQNPTIPNLPINLGGYYSVAITVDGCISTPLFTFVDLFPQPTVTASNSGAACPGGNITLTASSTSANVTGYQWSGPGGFTSTQQNPVLNGVTAANAGTYSVVAVNSNGCSSVAATTNVTLLPSPNASASNTGPVCVGGLVVLNSSTTTPGVATYQWSGPGGFTSTSQSPFFNSATLANAGVYSVTITVGGCASTAATTNLVVNPTPIAAASNNGPVCIGGAITLSGSTTTPGTATYAWSGPNGFTSTQQNPVINGVTALMAGTYSLTVTINSCPSAVATTTVVINPTPNATATNNGPVCPGGNVTLTASTATPGTATYAWSGPNGFTSTQQNPVINGVAAANAGNYTVTITINGCASAPASTTVVLSPTPTATASNNGPVCPGNSVTLTASTTTPGTATYSWSGPNGFTSTSATPTINGVTAAQLGVYSVTITINGCASAAATTTLAQQTAPTATATNTGPTCLGGSVTLNGSTTAVGTATYAWTGPNGFSSTLQNPVINLVTATTAGVYSLVVTVNGCVSAAVTTTLATNAQPNATAGSNSPVCAGSDINLTASTSTAGTAITYAWSGPNGFTSTQQNPVIAAATAAAAGTYSVVITVDGCASTAVTTDVVVNALPNATATNTGPACLGSNITLNGSTSTAGTATYAWSGPNGFTSTLQNPILNGVTAAAGGVYSLTVTINGCNSVAATTTVVVKPQPNATATNAGTCSGGSLTLNGATTTPGAPVTYAWTGPDGFVSAQQNPVINPATPANAGVYTLIITVAGCTSQAVTTTVIVGNAPTAVVNTSPNPVCNTAAGGATLDFNTLITGGDFGGTWTDVSGSGASGTLPFLNFTGVAAGNYTFTYTTNSAIPPCVENTYDVDVTVEDCTCPSVATSQPAPLCNNSGILDLFTLQITAQPGSWSITSTPPGVNPATISGNIFDATNADAGTYQITFTLTTPPPAGCPASSTKNIVVSNAGNAGNDNSIDVCNSDPFPVDLNSLLSGADAGGTWQLAVFSPSPDPGTFTPATGTFFVSGQTPGNYTFTYTIAATAPCTASVAQISVSVNEQPDATILATNPVCNTASGGSTVNLNGLLAPGASAGIWIDGMGNTVANTNLDFDGLAPGNYDYFYTTTSAVAPCINTNFGVTIIVEDCACPSVALSAPPALCNNSGTLNLSTIQITTQPGTWAITTTPPGATSPATLTGTTFNATGATPGTYQVTYTLGTPPPVGCPASGAQNITVVAAPNAGTGSATTVCNTQATAVILSDLLTGASGGGAWTLTGGTAQPGSFTAATGQFNPLGHPPTTLTFTYTVAGTAPCAAATTTATVTISAAPTAGSNGTLAICNTEVSPIQLTDLITGEDAGGTWTLTSGTATAGSFNAAAGTFNPNLHPTATLEFTYTLPAAGACAASTSTATVNVFAAASAGTGGNQQVCNSDLNLINLFTLLNAADAGGTWTLSGGTPDAGAFNAAAGTFAPNNHTPGTYQFTYTIAAAGSCPASTADVQIDVSGAPSATVTPSATTCNLTADGSVVNFNALITAGNTTGGWTETTSSGVSLANTAAVNFNGVAAGSYTFVYTLTAAAPCANPTYTVTVLVQDCSCPSVAITPPPALCNDLGTLDLSTLEITTSAGTWSITSTPAGANPAFLVGTTVNALGADPGTYTITFTLSTPPPPGCLLSASENLVVTAAANAGNGTDLEVCNSSTTPINLNAQLSGATAGGTWSVLAGTPDAGAFNAATGIFNPDGHTPGDITFAYTVTATAPCSDDVETVTLTVAQAVSAGIGGSLGLCNSEPTILDLFGLLGGASPGGTWSVTSGVTDAGAFNAATGTFNPNGHSPGVYTFTYTVTGASPCLNDTEDVIITINNALNAGFDTAIDVCNDSAIPINLLAQLTGADAGGIWTVSAASPNTPGGASFNAATGVFNPLAQANGAYIFTYEQPAVGDCNAVSADVTVNVGDAPTATLTSGDNVCNTTAAGALLDLSALITSGVTTGTWADTDGTGVDLSNPSAVDFNGITPGTYVFTYTVGGNGTCPAVSYPVDIDVEDCSCPSVATIPPAGPLCNALAVLDLSTLQITTQPGTWTITATPPAAPNPATLSGTIFTATGATPGTYTVTFTLDTPPPAGCPPSSSKNIVVNNAVVVGTGGSVDVCNDAGTLVDLSSLLTGANTGGTWTVLSGGPVLAAVNLAAGTFNTAGHPAGSFQFQYTITGTGIGACATASTNVTVNVSAALSATLTATATVCNTTADGSVLNFSSFITAGSNLGVWQDTDGSGVSLANLAAVDFNGIAAGDYVFTYALDAAAPCTDSAPFITITVEDCACPSVATTAPADLCNDSGSLDLSTLETTTEPGTWSITAVPVGANPATLTVTLFNAAGFDAGDYEITFTLDTPPPAGCAATSVQTLTVFNYGSAGTGSTDNVCNAAGSSAYDLATLLTNADLAGTWAVSAGSPNAPQGAAFDAISGTFNPDGQTPGDYEFSYTIGNTVPCTNSVALVTITVEDCNCVEPAAPLAITDAISICAGDVNAIAFEVSTAANTTVNWYDAAVGGNLLATDVTTYLASTAGTYYAEAINNPDDGCSSPRTTCTLTVNMVPIAAFTAPANTCSGQAESITFTGTASAGATYSWDFGTAGTQTGAGPHSITWNTTGLQTIVLAIDDNGCTDTISADIMVSGVTATATANPVSAELGTAIDLTASGTSAQGDTLTYTWSASAGAGVLSCTDCPNPITTMSGTATYTVTITDEFGCAATATATTTLIATPPIVNKVLIPNAFSPNGDNVNDVFRLTGVNVQEFELIIYNRWGTEVFSISSTNLDEGWDGTFKGKEQEVGTYVYYASAIFTDGEEAIFKGNVALIR